MGSLNGPQGRFVRLKGLYDCERDGAGWFTLSSNDAIDPYTDLGAVTATTPGKVGNVFLSWVVIAGAAVAVIGVFIWAADGAAPARRQRSSSH